MVWKLLVAFAMQCWFLRLLYLLSSASMIIAHFKLYMCTHSASTVTLSIYFHGNHKYNEQNKWCHVFLQAMNKNLHFMGYTVHGILLLPVLKCITHHLCSYPLFVFPKCSVIIDEYQWVPFFSIWRNSVIHLCFICTFMSDVISPDYCSVAICKTAKEIMGYW